MKLERKADKFAVKAHGEQVRKYTGEPYIEHPRAVARLVKTVDHNKYMIAAALLHDVVEDTEVTIEDIKREFGVRVAVLVAGLTDISRPEDGTRRIRKALDRNHSGEGSASIQTIKLADLIDNSRSINKHDQNFSVVYMAEKKLLLGVLTKGDKILHKQATKIVNEYYA